MKKIGQRIIAIFTIAAVVFYSLAPTLIMSVNAQEATESAVLESESSLTSTAEVTPTEESSPSASVEPLPTPEPSPTPSSESSPASIESGSTPAPQPVWTETDGGYTTQILNLGTTYYFPPNEKVSLTFTKLPEGSGTVTVREHEVPPTVENPGSLDYEITSSIPSGSFSFDLTLPTNDPQKQVLTSQDGQNYDPVSNETQITQDTITIKDITHLTHFIVADESATFNHVVINEFFVDGTSEWIELHNPTDGTIDLTDWVLDDNGVSPTTYTFGTDPGPTTISAKGFLAVSDNFGLNDTSPFDTVRLINSSSEVVDSRGYSSDPGTSSIGRTVDGGPDWTTFSTPTQGVSNGTTLGTLYVDNDWNSPDNDGGHTWGFDAFSSIQDAINFAPEGATINVAAGGYSEALTVNKSLSLVGPGITDSENLATINSVGSTAIDITASNVTVSGFDLMDECNCATIIYVRSGADSVTVSDNIIRDGGEAGVYVSGSGDPTENITIENNQINNNYSYGIYLEGDISGTNISNNSINQSSDGYGGIYSDSGDLTFTTLEIINNSQITDGNGYGIYFDWFSGTLTVSGNNLSNNYYEGIYLYAENSTVEISENTIESNGTNEGYSGLTINQAINSNITIQDNAAISSNGQYGIYLGSVDSDSAVNITGNIIQSNSSTGIYLSNSATNITITENTITDNGTESLSTGIVVQSASGNEAHQNIISTNGSVGVQNNDPENSFDAIANYWGSILGPLHEILNPNGGGDNVSDNVLFVPWYLTSDLTNLDSTDPSITFNMPLPDITSPSSIPVIATTNENATCKYSLDGSEFSAMDTTGATSHLKNLSGLEPGTHAIQLICTDSSGNSSTSSEVNWTVIDFNNIVSDVFFDSATEGQADLPEGITTLTLSNATNFDVSSGLNSASGNSITIGGVIFDLSDFTSGDIADYDFSVPQIIGGISFEIGKAVALESGTNGEPILLTNSDLSGVNVFLPDGVSVLAPNGWGGTIQPPKTGSSSGTAPSGFSVGSTVIEVGSSDIVLLFDSPVTVILTGVTGPVGYKAAGSTTWVQITNTCGGTYDSPTSPTFPGECAISNGTDTKIVTYHFTSFAALNTVSSTSSSSSSSGGGGGGSSTTPASAPVCNDTKPGSAPTLLSATAGVNFVTLIWSEASDPVTYYLVTYGEFSGAQTYGNPNIGGKGTTSYTVSGLSGGQTYYFRVRAGNGCMPGNYSNELSATPVGLTFSDPAIGFAPGVLGATTEEKSQVDKNKEVTADTQEVLPARESGSKPPLGGLIAAIGSFITALVSFFSRLFGR